MRQPVKLEGETKGFVIQNDKEKFYLTEREPETFVRKYNGFGISKVIIEKLSDSGVETVKVLYRGKQSTELFEASTEDWQKISELDELGGFEPQYFMSKTKLEKNRNHIEQARLDQIIKKEKRNS